MFRRGYALVPNETVIMMIDCKSLELSLGRKFKKEKKIFGFVEMGKVFIIMTYYAISPLQWNFHDSFISPHSFGGKYYKSLSMKTCDKSVQAFSV